jgi:glycosyltransferase involved in cell wall biosynthesis
MARTLVFNALRLSGKRTAIGRHIEYLAQNWSRMTVPFTRIVLLSPRELNLSDLGSTTRIDLQTLPTAMPNLYWEQVVLPRAASGAAMLFLEYTRPLAYRGRSVVANHGIYESTPLAFSWWSRLRSVPLYRYSSRLADRVIANSRSTRDDLVTHLSVPESKIDIVYPGPADLFFEPHPDESITSEVVRVLGQDAPYIIFVGKLARRRHVPNLMEAFAQVRRRLNLPHYLLLVGPNVEALPLEELAARHGISAHFKHLPHLDQPELARLYAGADLFVLPTIYEGISWTMFEAMASGTAVLTVDHPALREGAAEAVLALPTPSVDDLIRGLGTLLGDTAARSELERKGAQAVKRFSLHESARATMEILDRVAAPTDGAGLTSA